MAIANPDPVLAAIAELPWEGWEFVRNLSRAGSLATLHRRLAIAEERGWVERRDQNPHGMRRIWRVRLTVRGRNELGFAGYNPPAQGA